MWNIFTTALSTLLLQSVPIFDNFMPCKSLSFTAKSRSKIGNLDAIKSSKGVLFDIDGTLADSWKLGFDATQVVLTNYGIDAITEDSYHKGCVYTTPERLARHVGLLPGDENFDELGGKLGMEFDDYYVKLVSTETASFYDGMEELLLNMPKSVKIGALTNACVGYGKAVLQVNNNVIEMFSSVHGADDVPAPKPFGDGLLLCCQEMGLDPAECVYVGDSPTDAKAAEEAGMPSIGVLWGSNSEERLSKAPFLHLCSTISELREILPQKE
mmetsp:Transcript_37769/g.44005  ORF Transcript_37769/g.44005 Transcript_37769/m.44005 type:complete len:270 (-) Transcript_37769:379-1188(-)